MDRTYLEINFPNIVSIWIMGAVGAVLLAFLASAIRGFGKDKGGQKGA